MLKTAVIKSGVTLELVERLSLGNGKVLTFSKSKEKVNFSELTCEDKRKILDNIRKTDFMFT